VAVVIAAGDLRVEDIKAGRQAAVIAAATPEAAHAVALPAEALHLQAAILPQERMAVDSSRAGAMPAFSHRQEVPKGASCSS
jgi:hypothetical protein